MGKVSSDGREPPSRSFAVATGDGKLAAPNLLTLQGLGSELVCSQNLLCIGQGQRSREAYRGGNRWNLSHKVSGQSLFS